MKTWLVDGGLLDRITLHPLWSALVALALLIAVRLALRLGPSRDARWPGDPRAR